jgi:DNA-directed RNA polymerase subunit RPC12/RpoP
MLKCKYCGKETYKRLFDITTGKNLFCSQVCANNFQGRNKLKFVCIICGNNFKLSKSIANGRKYQIKYCSIKCRNEDPNFKINACIKGNLIQQHKKGLNKLELRGRKILEDLGLVLNKDFKEQVLMFNKFLVDILN